MATIVATVLSAAFCAWRISTPAASILVGVILCGTAMAVDIEFRRQWHAAHQLKQEQKQESPPPVPVRIELPDEIAGAALTINGVSVGSTPYETTLQELLNTVPVWTHDDARKANSESRTDWTFDKHGLHGSGAARYGWLPINVPHQQRTEFPTTDFRVKVDLGEMPGFTRLARSRKQADGSTVNIPDTVFPAWENEIKGLLDVARMADYDVSPLWYDSFGSYGSWGQSQLSRAMYTEPQLQQVLKDCSNHVYGLDNVKTAPQAWDTLMRIGDEAVGKGRYHTDSLAGLAVDRLTPLLDPQQLCSVAQHVITTERFPNFQQSWGPSSMHFTSIPSEDRTPPEMLRWLPVAHAVWRLDQREDQQGFAADNIVERQVTPALLRAAYQNPSVFASVRLLGGSAWEKFLLRQHWESIEEDSMDAISIGDYENRISKWYAELMNLDSPAGQQFREAQAERLLLIARRAFRDHDTSLPSELNYLFLDHDRAASARMTPSWAMQFWPILDGIASVIPDHSKNQRLILRWDYLSRLWPESDVEMFQEAYLQELPIRQHPALPDTVPLQDQFRILQRLRSALQQKLATLKPSGRQSSDDLYTMTKIAIDDADDALRNLPYRPSAELFVAYFESRGSDSSAIDGLLERMSYDSIHHDHVELLARHSNPQFRTAALLAIRRHPITRRVRLLSKLIKDEDSGVREQAIRIDGELEELKRGPFPLRQIPRDQ